jgi:PAS domain-containing protein
VSALGGVLPAWVAQHGGLLAVKDADTGRYVHVNEAMAAFLGRTPSQVLGHVDSDWFEAPLSGALRAAEQTAMAQGAPGGRTVGQKMVKRGFSRSGQRLRAQATQHAGCARRSHVNDLVANGHAAAKGLVAAGAAKHRQRQVLDRKVAAICVGRGHPTGGICVVGVVQFSHTSLLN